MPPLDSLTSEQFREHLRTLHFATDTEVGDRQPLLLGHYPDSARYGPLATILPEAKAFESSGSRMRRGTVIARISNEGGDSYPKLGLMPHAVTYWVVQYDAGQKQGRSVFIAVDADTNIIGRTQRGLEIVSYHEHFKVTQSLARFVWSNSDEEVWGTCWGKCCKSTS